MYALSVPVVAYVSYRIGFRISDTGKPLLKIQMSLFAYACLLCLTFEYKCIGFSVCIVTRADGSGGDRFYLTSFERLFFRTISQKPMQLYKIIKLGTEMYHDESGNPFIFWVRRSKIQVTSQKQHSGVGLCILVSAGFL